MNTALLLAAALCILTAGIHSYVGERGLIRALVAMDTGVMETQLAKHVVRLAWHWTSLLWILVALYLVVVARGDEKSTWLLAVIGSVHLLAGVVDGLVTKGKHIGWAPITLIGLLILVGNFASS